MEDNPARLMGVENTDLGVSLLDQTLKAWKPSGESPADTVVSYFQETEPSNPQESMLLSQMASAHSYALKLLSEAESSISSDVEESKLKMADRLMRTFNQAFEKLNKSRKGGSQNVKVEYVHVDGGSQAIVGVTNQGEKSDE